MKQTEKKVNYIKKVNIYKSGMPLWARVLLKAIFITFIICCLFVAVFSFIYICTPVDGKSMLPTLNAECYDEYGELIEGSKKDSVYINRFASFDYGDIIVVNNPSSNAEGKYVIKRLIAKGGDKIAIAPVTNETLEKDRTYKIFLIKQGSNIIEVLDEPYLSEKVNMYNSYSALNEYKNKNLEKFQTISTGYGNFPFLIIEKDEFFYMGDNRSESKDCSNYGAISKEKYVGRVDIIAYKGENNFSYVFLYFWHKIFG